ncbi:MAG: hypothetical protein HPM95_14420 [Alphaproteobacteria bacterium]|nr:hypothetical protein [Alphaproteobacteria bacterium]
MRVDQDAVVDLEPGLAGEFLVRYGADGDKREIAGKLLAVCKAHRADMVVAGEPSTPVFSRISTPFSR